jgi:hypothetical protein
MYVGRLNYTFKISSRLSATVLPCILNQQNTILVYLNITYSVLGIKRALKKDARTNHSDLSRRSAIQNSDGGNNYVRSSYVMTCYLRLLLKFCSSDPL